MVDYSNKDVKFVTPKWILDSIEKGEIQSYKKYEP